jgi:ubiquinone/menaquinone biosynthesis C-methylase UbiE
MWAIARRERVWMGDSTMATPAAGFDPIEFKESTRRQWENAADAWDRWGPTLQRWLEPVTEAMLQMARLVPGDRVLDVAGGSGEPALAAVARVSPGGYVLSIDITTNLVRLADRNARTRGLAADRFEARVMDGEHLELTDASFDAALSRLGLIYFPDRPQALAEIHRVLKPGGRVALASFTTPAANPFFAIAIGIIRRRVHLSAPASGSPGPFSMGSREVMEEALRLAGFGAVETRVVAAPLRFATADECLRFEQEAFGALHEMLASVSESERVAAWAEVEEELARLEGPSGFESPGELLVGAATR